MARALKAVIDCCALTHNLHRVKERAPGCGIMAMVKANGYGHGIVTVAKALADADAYGVACIEEATQLFQAGIQKPIVLMEGFFETNELPDVFAMKLHLVVHHEKHLQELEMFCKSRATASLHREEHQIPVWIKIDTGMHRLGFPSAALQSVMEALENIPSVKIVGVLTHFSRADELGHAETQQQTNRFAQTLKTVRKKLNISLANSAGILGWSSCLTIESIHGLYTPWVRPGIMLYGVSPFLGRTGKDEGLKPVMTLSSKLIAIQTVPKGDAVGYGGTYVVQQDSLIGIVAVGYGDGYPRLMPTGTPVLVNGVRVPLVGRVSMDMLSVDLSSLPNSKVGDLVQLWGPELPVEEIAVSMGTTAYELLTGLSTRVPCQAFGACT